MTRQQGVMTRVMDLRPYFDGVRHELLVAANAGREGPHVGRAPGGTAGVGMHVTLPNAFSAAAGQIARELAPGSVDLRLRGLDPSFVVTDVLSR